MISKPTTEYFVANNLANVDKTAYKKDYGNRDENVNVHFDLESGELEISVEKTVVKVVEDPNTEISFEELGDDAD